MPLYSGAQRIARLYRGATPIARAYRGAALVYRRIPPDFLGAIQALGLGAGLRLCHDYGDAACYPGSGQQVADCAGATADFVRGATGAGEASDPAFNGTAGGLSAAEYFSFDGGDFLTLDAANPAWVQTFHKAGAKLTIAAWVANADLGVAQQGICGTRGAVAGNTGAAFYFGNGGALTWDVRNAGTSVCTQVMNSASALEGAWQFAAVSVDASVGAGGLVWFQNGATETDDSTFSSPSTGGASFTMQIGARGGNNNPLRDGARLGAIMIWDRALAFGEMQSVFNATRDRYDL